MKVFGQILLSGCLMFLALTSLYLNNPDHRQLAKNLALGTNTSLGTPEAQNFIEEEDSSSATAESTRASLKHSDLSLNQVAETSPTELIKTIRANLDPDLLERWREEMRAQDLALAHTDVKSGEILFDPARENQTPRVSSGEMILSNSGSSKK